MGKDSVPRVWLWSLKACLSVWKNTYKFITSWVIWGGFNIANA